MSKPYHLAFNLLQCSRSRCWSFFGAQILVLHWLSGSADPMSPQLERISHYQWLEIVPHWDAFVLPSLLTQTGPLIHTVRCHAKHSSFERDNVDLRDVQTSLKSDFEQSDIADSGLCDWLSSLNNLSRKEVCGATFEYEMHHFLARAHTCRILKHIVLLKSLDNVSARVHQGTLDEVTSNGNNTYLHAAYAVLHYNHWHSTRMINFIMDLMIGFSSIWDDTRASFLSAAHWAASSQLCGTRSPGRCSPLNHCGEPFAISLNYHCESGCVFDSASPLSDPCYEHVGLWLFESLWQACILETECCVPCFDRAGETRLPSSKCLLVIW